MADYLNPIMATTLEQINKYSKTFKNTSYKTLRFEFDTFFFNFGGF